MPLHEYLEQKRLQNIAQLNAECACHICGSNCRNSIGFSQHVLGNQCSSLDGVNYCNEHSMVKPPNMAAMRTCSCFGIPETDANYCPTSLRVCDRCIEDDKGIGRIRICGACGTVACDEFCGPELLECTDSPEWNNAGCLECRRMGDFSELGIFKRSTNDKKEARITRICITCLKQSTPWVTHDFVCRRFHCETRLVLSDIVERKRFTTFGSSPLNLLPEDGLVAVVDFLSGSDLRNLFFTCSAMCTVAERVAMNKVMNFNDIIPTGPIVFESKALSNGKTQEVMRLEGSNSFGLRAPDDERAWVGLYHFLEKLTKEMFHFSFQIEGKEAGEDVVGRFINQSRGEKFMIGKTYDGTVKDKLIEHSSGGLSIRGGTVLVTGRETIIPSIVITSSKHLDAGTQRVICRLFCPGIAQDQLNPRALAREIESSKVGSIGIMTSSIPLGDGPTAKLVTSQDLFKPGKTDEIVFGMSVEYDDDVCNLSIINSTGDRFSTHDFTVERTSDDLHYIAVELTATVLNEPHALLSFRNCDEEEWGKFLKHTCPFTTMVTEWQAHEPGQRHVNEQVRRLWNVGLLDDANM